jgi:hypothetical protein
VSCRCLLGSFGFEILLEPGVLLFKVGNFFLISGELFLRIKEFLTQELIFALHAVDMFSELFEGGGTTARASLRKNEIPKWLSSPVMRSFAGTHPPYVESLSGICSAF